MTNIKKVFALVLLLAAASTSGDDIDQNEVLKLRLEGKVLPFEQIQQRIHQRYADSRFLEVELDEEDGKLIYEIEILTGEGVVRELEVDAASGEVLEDELED